MLPPYGFMDSYPHTSSQHRDHIPYPCHYYPSWEAVSPQTTVDTQRPPSSFGPWSINGGHTHPTVTDCNGCCSHGYHPGFCGFRPPCPHTPPLPPQLYCQGPYPPYYGSYPSFVIPPYYPADQNPYGCNSVKAHCCNCPDHACTREDRNRVKIEEQKSERDLDKGSSSLIQSPNYPYPVWIPPGYLKDKETNKGSEAPPAVWNGWIPMDISNRNGRKLHEDGKNNLQTKERRNQFPWPIIWMPGDEKLEDSVKDLKEVSSHPKVEEKLPSNLRIIPLKLLEDMSHGEKPGDADDKLKTVGHSKAVAEDCRTRTIPVRQIEEDKHEKLSTDEKHKDKDKEKFISIPETEKENGVKKSSDSKQLPGAKTSKLPPVCLRVDPLPRKKSTANGPSRSRSSSPPNLSDREKPHKDKKGGEKEEMPKKEIKVIDVNDEAEKSKKKMQDTEATGSNKGAAKSVEIQVDKDDEKQPIDKAPGGHVENVERTISEPIKERKILSESDAATLIQSAYRGFEVRRGQPLEKLRKISQIHQKAEAVKKQIQEFEAASKGLDLKQKTVTSETIMNLLLQLDTIQGLQQNLRDVRKSLARELVALQEKLDSVGTTASTEHEEMKVEHCPTVTGSGRGAISAAVSYESIDSESEHVSSELVDATNSSEESFMDGKEADIEQPRDVEIVMAESADSSTGPDNSKSFNVEKDSVESILYSAPHGVAAEKEQPYDMEEVTKPLASASQGVSEADAQLEDNVFVYQVGDELSDPQAGSAGKHDDVGLEKSSALYTKVEANEMATEESKPEMEELAELAPGTMGAEIDSGVMETLLLCDEVDSMKAVQVPAVESNPDQEAVAEKDAAAHAIRDIPCYEQATHAIKSGALEARQEDGVSPMLMPGAVDIMKDKCFCPDKTTEGTVDNKDCAALDLSAIEDLTDQRPRPDALEVQKDRCIAMDETSEANASEYDATDATAAEEAKDYIVPDEDMPQLVNPEATVAEPNTGPSGQQECLAYSVETAKLDAVASCVNLSKEEKELLEVNEKLRETLERLLEAGKAQMGVIADLNGRVKELEKKIAQKKRRKVKSLKTKKNSTTLRL